MRHQIFVSEQAVFTKGRVLVFARCLCGFDNSQRRLRCPRKKCKKSLRARSLNGKRVIN